MNRKTALILAILIAITIPGALGDSLTAPIEGSEDDVWMTEAGNVFGYESSVRILDGSIGLRAFLRFENVSIAKSDKIDLATLYVFAGWDQGGSPDPGASVTIYGIAEPDCSPFSYSGRVWSLERPLTSASVNWNLTTWGYGWHSVNVTDIVKEVVSRYAWEENNSLGFQILGASDSGQEVRTFEDIDHQYSGNYAYLYIQYNLPPGVPPGLPPGAIFVETYQDWDIWNYTTTSDVANYTDMTQTGSLARLNVFNESQFNWTNINKDTVDVALGYFMNLTQDDDYVNGYEFDFNFTMDIDIHNIPQPDPYMIMVGAELTQIGSLNDIFAGNEIVGFDTYTIDGNYYKFLPRFFGTDGPTFGNYSDACLKNTWYMGKAILEGTLLRLEVRTMAGVIWTACQLTLPRVQNVYTFLPLICAESVAGSQMDGHMIKDPSTSVTEFYLVDENGTVVDTWTLAPGGENFTDIDDLKDWTDDVVNPQGGDPLDPAPGAGWEETGPFTRFRMRLYFMIIGVACIFVPIWAISYKRPGPQGVAWCCMLILIGLGLLISIPNI